MTSREPDSWLLAAHLRDRLQAQVDGQLPMDADELMQHRLVAAVFGSPYLSPTPLRRLATSLRDGELLAPLARKPVTAFIDKHGAHRSPR